jgi:hypothetical protein
MFVFVSPNSIRSSWIHFEVGYAYSKGVKVIPVGIVGLDLGQVSPPLSLLQGFNITSEAGLNNLIAVINQEFEHAHEESFTRHDYESVFVDASAGRASSINSTLTSLIEKAGIDLDGKEPAELDGIEQCLKDKFIEYTRQGNVITSYGLSIVAHGPGAGYGRTHLEITVGSELASATFPVVGEFISSILGGSQESVSVVVELSPGVSIRKGHPNVTARLFGTAVSLGPGETLQYKGISFTMDYNTHMVWNSGPIQGSAYIKIICQAGQLSSLDIEGLLDILFTQGVLFVEPNDIGPLTRV